MAVAMKISDELVNDAKPYAAAEHRSVPKQIEYWARIGKAVTEIFIATAMSNSYKQQKQK